MPFTNWVPKKFENEDQPLVDRLDVLEKLDPFGYRMEACLIQGEDGRFWVELVHHSGHYDRYSDSSYFLVDEELARAIISEHMVSPYRPRDPLKKGSTRSMIGGGRSRTLCGERKEGRKSTGKSSQESFQALAVFRTQLRPSTRASAPHIRREHPTGSWRRLIF